MKPQIKDDRKNAYKFRSHYPSFPEIPVVKRWPVIRSATWEQLIVDRMMKKQRLVPAHEAMLKKAIVFYEKVIAAFKNSQYSKLVIDIERFKGYFWYAFNNIPMAANTITRPHLVRLVRNKSVCTNSISVTHASQVSYPSADIVKKAGKYNRANTPDFNLFYGSNSIDAVLNEVQPETGELVTVGLWQHVGESEDLVVYPIDHHRQAINNNNRVSYGYDQFQRIFSGAHPLLKQFMETLFGFISDEYAKPINDHTDYLVSALFTEYLLTKFKDENWPCEAIAYPSVENKFSTHNLAVKPEVIKNNYRLQKVIEFEIGKVYGERIGNITEIEAITLVEPLLLRSTTNIDEQGNIFWN